jgi:DHA3 family tetracycline resistance protein-like MFS transporter
MNNDTLEQKPPSRIGILRPLKIRDFALLWSGMTISLLGDGIYAVAVAFQVYELSNDPAALSMVFVAWTAPMLVFFLIAGVLTDRLDRRLMMIAADVIRGMAIGAIGFLSLTGDLTLTWMVVLVAFYGVGEALFMPAFTAIVPDIVPPELLVEANSLDQFVRPLGMRFAGPALGGVLVATVDPGGAFVFDAVTFAVSAIAVAWIKPRTVQRGDGDRLPIWKEIREGVSFVRRHVWLWGTLTSAAVGLLFFMGPMDVLIPFVVKNELRGDAADFGWILSAGGVGAIIMSLVMGQRGLPKRHMTFMYLSWTVGVLLIGSFALVQEVWQAMAFSFVMSALFTAGMIVWGTLMHRLVPSNLLGRVSSLDWLISTAFVPISFLLTGPSAKAFGADATLLGAGIIGALITVGCLFLPGMRATERDGSLRAEAIALREEEAALL